MYEPTDTSGTPSQPQTLDNDDIMREMSDWWAMLPDGDAADRPVRLENPTSEPSPLNRPREQGEVRSILSSNSSSENGPDPNGGRHGVETEAEPEGKPLIIVVYLPGVDDRDWLPPRILSPTVDMILTCTIAGFERLIWDPENRSGDDLSPSPNPRLRGVVLTTLELFDEMPELTQHIEYRHQTSGASWPLILAPAMATHEQDVEAERILNVQWRLPWRISGWTRGLCFFEVTREAEVLHELNLEDPWESTIAFSGGIFRLLGVERNDQFLQLAPGERLRRRGYGDVFRAVDPSFVPTDSDRLVSDTGVPLTEEHDETLSLAPDSDEDLSRFLASGPDEVLTEWCAAALDSGTRRGFIGYLIMQPAVMRTVLSMCGIRHGHIHDSLFTRDRDP